MTVSIKMNSNLNIIKYIIVARMSSTRLPDKMLKPLNGHPLLWYPIQAIQNFAGKDSVIVATSQDQSDDPIADYCAQYGIQCYRGDLLNAAKRFRDCLNDIDCDYAVRVCGDNVFVSHELLREFSKLIHLNTYDFISNTKGRTFPFGMSLEAVRKDIFINHYSKFDEKSGDLEHIMPYFYRSDSLETFFFKNDIYPEAKGIHIAIDTLDDFHTVENMLQSLRKPYYECTLEDIAGLYG